MLTIQGEVVTMDKLQFDSFHKFVASLGLAALVAAAALPYLYLKDAFGLLVKEAEYTSLIPSAQKLVISRLALVMTLNKAVPLISMALLVTGLILTVWAMRMWLLRQKVVNQKEDVDLQKAKNELRDMTESEKEKKATTEVATAPAVEIVTAPVEVGFTEARSSTLREQYLSVEREVAAALSRQLVDRHGTWTLYANQKLGEHEYDMILHRKGGVGLQDVLFEVKFSTHSRIPVNWVIEAALSLAVRGQAYEDRLHRRAQLVVLVIYTASARSNIQRVRESVAESIALASTPNLKVEFINLEQLPAFDFLDLIEP